MVEITTPKPGSYLRWTECRLPSAEREQARQLPEHEGITISELARRALEEHLHRAS